MYIFRINILIIFLLNSIILPACKENPASRTQPMPDVQKSPITNINADQAKKMIAENKELVILDVRTPGEVKLGIIENAKVIDISQPDFEKMVGQLDKNKPTLVYCKAGGRSQTACSIMTKLGFKELYNLESGYDGWK